MSLASALIIAVWFGVIVGLLEGMGLLVFQRLNWARWGPMLHVSAPILWISVLVDVLFFSLIAFAVWLTSRIARWPLGPILVCALTILAIYDWLALTGRLYRWSCLLVAIGAAFAFTRWFRANQAAALRFWKKTFPWVATAAVVVCVAVEGDGWLRERRELQSLPTAQKDLPNVLIIIVDTLRADHLSSYGYFRPTSPAIDQLAQQGVLFENAIATASWSFPSHVSLLTGRYAFEGKTGSIPPMSPLRWTPPDLGGFPTLGESLEQRGYRTAAFSANRTYFSRDLGFGRGFSRFEDYFHSPADMFVRTFYGKEFARIYLSRTDRSKPKRLLRWLGFDSLLDPDEEGSGSYGGALGVRKRATTVTSELVRWIDRGSQARPFFACLNFFDVHGSYGGPRSAPRPPWPQEGTISQYDDGIAYVDGTIRQLMTDLDQRGLVKNTLIVVTSDHGEALGQHYMNTHGVTLYRELLQVPLIFWYPGHIPSGLRLETVVTNAAVPATIVDLLGGPNPFPGPGLDALWRDSQPPANWPNPLSELDQNRYPGKVDLSARDRVPTAFSGSMQSLFTDRWHVIMHDKEKTQLYDWRSDPGELQDLADDPSSQQTLIDLKSEIRKKMAEHPGLPK